LYASIFSQCDAKCANPASTKADLTACINHLDCLNNGGKNGPGGCQTGTCASDGTTACDVAKACGDGSVCQPLDGNCHSQLLVNSELGFTFEPPGAAGSSNECNAANQNRCKVIGAATANCKF